MMLKKVLLICLIALGSLTWVLTIFKSGLNYSYGQGFWGANGHDGIWHIAVAQALTKGNLNMPIYAGEKIQNYHVGFDVLLALLNRITTIPISTLYFQIIPIIFSVLMGYLTYIFVFIWTKSYYSSVLSVFFIYFGGSLAWILGKGESAFWSQQAISTLINPPFALSMIFIFLGILCLQKKNLIFGIICFGLLLQIKAYAAVLVLGGLFVSSIFEYFIKKESFTLKLFLGSLILNLFLFFVVGNNVSSVFIFKPFWFLETMMQLTDRVGWVRFGEAMVNYKNAHNLIKGPAAYLIVLVIFVLGNFGTRIIFLVKNIKIDKISIFVYSIIIGGLTIPMFLVQKGTAWNTIQFLYYSLFFSGILAGIALSKLPKYWVVAIILLTIPTTYLTLKDVYLSNRPPAIVSNDELAALEFLKKQEDGIVLTYPFDRQKAKEAENNPPRPLYLYESTAYVSAFSGKTVFLEDEVNLEITGYEWKDRGNLVKKLYKEESKEKAREFLTKNNIRYVYWMKPQRALLGDEQLGLIKIFENEKVEIYVVKQSELSWPFRSRMVKS